MSYKQAVFAFSAKTDVSWIIETLSEAVDHVRMDVPIGRAYVVLKEINGVCYAMLLSTPLASGGHANREPFVSFLSDGEHGVVFIGHDDQNGVYVFEQQHQDRTSHKHFLLVSRGAELGGNVDGLTVDYPQKGFTAKELKSISVMDESSMTNAQYMAVAEYENAAQIGVKQVFGESRGNYLSLCHTEQCYDLDSPAMQLVNRPDGLMNIVSYWPTSQDEHISGVVLSVGLSCQFVDHK
jgi:hypothetical protein